MQIHLFADARSFLAATDRFLMDDEASHTFILSAVTNLLQKEPRSLSTPPWLAAMHDDAGFIVGTGVWVNGSALLLSEMPAAAARLMADSARANTTSASSLARVLGPPEVAESFCQAWEDLGGPKAMRALEMRLLKLELNKVTPETRVTPGRLRRAWLEDLPTLEKWAADFANESGLGDSSLESAYLVRRQIESRGLFVWQDGQPVTMVAWSGNTLHGARLSSVYTPPEFRRKGYARSCVFGLGELLHQMGKKFACLTLSLGNEEAAGLYRNLGYLDAGLIDEFYFKPDDPVKPSSVRTTG